jgi:hypothetical protein
MFQHTPGVTEDTREDPSQCTYDVEWRTCEVESVRGVGNCCDASKKRGFKKFYTRD